MYKETQKEQRFIEKIESIEIPCRYSLLCDEIEQVVGSAVFGIVLTMDKQLEEIETNI